MDIFLILLVLVILVSLFQKGKGTRGENRVNLRLQRGLNSKCYRVLNNLIIPSPAGTTQIDHVVVSLYGVFVIETKNYDGWIFGQAGQKRWTQVLFKKKSSFQNPTFQNFKHIKAIQKLTGLDASQIFNLVVFVGNAKFKTEIPANVFNGTHQLNKFILSCKERLLTPSEMDLVLNLLMQSNTGNDKQARKKHLQQLRSNLNPVGLSNSAPDCPRCGEIMKIRVARKSGKKFWGCSGYPKCRGTRPSKN
jgi:hypothetical protein